MEKIFLASTDNIFVHNTSKDIQSSIPNYKDKNVSVIKDKEQLLRFLQQDEFDLLIIDNTLITEDEIKNTNPNGRVWLIDPNLSSKTVNGQFCIWNSSKDYKQDLFRLGMSNPMKNSKKVSLDENSSHVQEVDRLETKQMEGILKEELNNDSADQTKEKYKQSINKNSQREISSLSDNQKEILASQGKDIEDKKSENEKKMPDPDATIISIAPPYPNEISESVQTRLIEAKKMQLKLQPEMEEKEKRIVDLEPYVNEYFHLVSYREFIKQMDKRLLATLKMKDYINMNQSRSNKSIGVWSPNRQIGVTTFVMNFAFYIGQQKRLPISVMEALREDPIMFKELERIAPKKHVFPKKWYSYVTYVNTCKDIDEPQSDLLASSVIDFKGVYWFPLGKGNVDYKNSVIDDIPYYIFVSNPQDVVIVDLPNGELKKDTRETLKHLNELWILMDGSTDMIFGYKDYIKKMKLDNPHLSIYIIFQNYFPIVAEKLIRDTFDYPVLATLPDLNNEVRKNKYEHMSVMDNPNIESLLSNSFHDIGVHVYQETYNKSQLNRPDGSHTITKMLEKLRNLFV
ncbi:MULTISPECIES: hypothetical protein [Oceanobacillus]|uniref:Uncharacterized protein n=1 Tax=Oceanobacillus kimchii TaxID=746691 RepID=A0ABQ5TQ29_9BACI|nr:hypothetical protein [Oceanobacillus kimchii]GLO68302.1 hypothetical protein MACH08_40860 [Oceanobacillus kimchii]